MWYDSDTAVIAWLEVLTKNESVVEYWHFFLLKNGVENGSHSGVADVYAMKNGPQWSRLTQRCHTLGVR